MQTIDINIPAGISKTEVAHALRHLGATLFGDTLRLAPAVKVAEVQHALRILGVTMKHRMAAPPSNILPFRRRAA